MKTSLALALLATAALAAPGVFGQGMPADRGPDMRLGRILGADRSFSATAVMTMKQGSGKGIQTLETEFAVLAGKVRTEMDMTKNAALDAAARQQMAAMGMGRVISIVRPDLKKTFMIYPGLKAYCEIPQRDAAQNPDPAKMPKIEKTELGRETLDGHPCVKQQVTVTEEGGKAFTSLVWEATDLAGFPIQTQMKTGDDEVTTRFKNINKEKPAASLFDPPAGFQRYGSMQEMMMGAMRMKMQLPDE